MNNHIKELLVQAAGSPDAERKDLFIRQYKRMDNRTEKKTVRFIFFQMAYISWYIWAFSGMVILGAIAYFVLNGGYDYADDTIRAIAGWMPFISALAVFEEFRSKEYKMYELESTTKVSFRGVYFARVSCIGLMHMVVIIVITLFLGSASKMGYLVTWEIFTIPYLIVSIINTKIERTEFGRKNSLTCFSVSVLFSAVMVALNKPIEMLLTMDPAAWEFFLIILLVADCYEIRETMKEKFAWN